MDAELAINGGTPVRTERLPERKTFGPEEEAQVLEALRAQNLFCATGTKVYEFVRKFAAFYGVSDVVPSTSGTAAIHVALGTINPEPGSEVIVTPISDMGSVAPIILCNCIPVFADVDLASSCVDPNAVADAVTDRTKAIIVVHCWGRPAELDDILAIARGRGIAVIEDCAQSHGVRYKGRLTGTMGDMGAFSFQQSKLITCGDGGATIVNNLALAERAHLYADKGCDWTEDRKYRRQYHFMAPCYRMSELQGAVLSAQMDRLEGVVRRRMQLGDMLTEQIAGVPGVTPGPPSDADHEHGYWHYPFYVDPAVLGVPVGDFMRALRAEGIDCSQWLGQPLYMYRALTDKITYGNSHYPFDARPDVEYGEGLCPNAEEVCRTRVVVALHEGWTEDDVVDVATAIRKVAGGLAEAEKA